jgi:hypothetical protein
MTRDASKTPDPPVVDEAESGSASIWVLAMAALILLAAASAGLDGAAVAARHRAGAAADLASLAAAAQLAKKLAAAPAAGVDSGVDSGVDAAAACATASRVAASNGAKLQGCVVDGSTVTVAVASPVQGLAGALGAMATAGARAGPA